MADVWDAASRGDDAELQRLICLGRVVNWADVRRPLPRASARLVAACALQPPRPSQRRHNATGRDYSQHSPRVATY